MVPKFSEQSLARLSLALWMNWPLTGGTAFHCAIWLKLDFTGTVICVCPRKATHSNGELFSLLNQVPPSHFFIRPWRICFVFFQLMGKDHEHTSIPSEIHGSGPGGRSLLHLDPLPFKAPSFPFSIGRAITHGSGSYVILIELLELSWLAGHWLNINFGAG